MSKLGLRLATSFVCRSYHVTSVCNASTPDKQLLSKLRKTTGFSFVNCRKALEKFDNNISLAEAWLREQAQKEGWTKASKLQGRPMSQGLIGLTVQDKYAAILEVNCETDFVARNAKFHSFVSLVTSTFLQHGSASGQNKIVVDQKSLGSLLVDGRTIADLTALEVGNIGENIAVRRGVFLCAQDAEHIASYVHVIGPPRQSSHHLSTTSARHQCLTGKYGALVLYCPSNEAGFHPPPPEEGGVPIEELGRRLCQHVVGMNPRSIGTYEKPSNELRAVDHVNSDDVSGSATQDANSLDVAGGVGSFEGVVKSEGEEMVRKEVVEDTEDRFVYQEYMLDTTVKVGDILEQNGVRIVDFVRLECGSPDDVAVISEPVAEEQRRSVG